MWACSPQVNVFDTWEESISQKWSISVAPIQIQRTNACDSDRYIDGYSSCLDTEAGKKGRCLDASQRDKNGGLVHMWDCDLNERNQHWEYDEDAGQLRNMHTGKCMSA